jgi:arylsulfatase A-like enzyme
MDVFNALCTVDESNRSQIVPRFWEFPSMLSRLTFQVILSLTIFSLGVGVVQAAKRPNILLIYTDDQSYKTVGCYPEAFPWAKTSHIDSIAQSGVRVERAYLGSWCMPSRASILTGRHPHAIESMRMEGKYPGSTYDPEKCPFWPAVLRKHGYHTAQIGKWHTGTDAGFGRDWDYQVVWNRPKHPENAGNYYYNQLLCVNDRPTMVAEYSTDHYTKLATEYIRGQNRAGEKPWFLWLCYGGVHGPTTPAKRHIGTYKDAKVTPPADIFGPRPGKPSYLEKTQAWAKGKNGEPVMGKSGEKFGDESDKNPRTHQAFVQQVNECVRALDEGVGEVLKALRESGQLENTFVVFTADQGFSLGEHGCRSKICPYDANYASPILVSFPGRVPAGKVCRQCINAPDLTVTFLRLAELDAPWTMHGRDLLPILKEPEKADGSLPVLYEHLGHHYGSDVGKLLKESGPGVHSNVPWYIAVRQGHWKYVNYLGAKEPDELYDLKADPEELTNLAGQQTYAATLARIREVWRSELKRTGADAILEHLP